MDINEFIPGKNLYHEVRGGFVAHGTSLNAWCKTRGISRPNAVLALMGVWDGPKGRELRTELIDASGINKQSAIAV